MLRRGHYRNFVIGFASPILNLDSAKKASEGETNSSALTWPIDSLLA